MAYYLQLDGEDDLVSFPSGTFKVIDGKLKAGIDAALTSVGQGFVMEVAGYFSGIKIYFTADGNLFATLRVVENDGGTGALTQTPSKSITIGQRHDITVTLNVVTREFTLTSGGESFTASSLIDQADIDALTGLSYVSDRTRLDPSAAMQVYSCIINDRYYDPSASGGTGLVLPDTQSGQDGTLVNFPDDNSQWVYYDDGTGRNEAPINGPIRPSIRPVIRSCIRSSIKSSIN